MSKVSTCCKFRKRIWLRRIEGDFMEIMKPEVNPDLGYEWHWVECVLMGGLVTFDRQGRAFEGSGTEEVD